MLQILRRTLSPRRGALPLDPTRGLPSTRPTDLGPPAPVKNFQRGSAAPVDMGVAIKKPTMSECIKNKQKFLKTIFALMYKTRRKDWFVQSCRCNCIVFMSRGCTVYTVYSNYTVLRTRTSPTCLDVRCSCTPASTRSGRRPLSTLLATWLGKRAVQMRKLLHSIPLAYLALANWGEELDELFAV